MKKRHTKKFYEEAYNDLLKDFKQLSENEDNLREEIQKIKSLVIFIKHLKIDLEKLEELGLHRYNAEYGKRVNDGYCGITSTFISEPLYEELIQQGFIYQWRSRK